MFYREAGNPANPTLLLLHGFASSSFQFRDLIPLLAHKFPIVAPDLPGFGFTTVPDAPVPTHSFDAFGQTLTLFVVSVGLPHHALDGFAYGALSSLRLELIYPRRAT